MVQISFWAMPYCRVVAQRQIMPGIWCRQAARERQQARGRPPWVCAADVAAPGCKSHEKPDVQMANKITSTSGSRAALREAKAYPGYVLIAQRNRKVVNVRIFKRAQLFFLLCLL
jgi:hypothetical protein